MEINLTEIKKFQIGEYEVVISKDYDEDEEAFKINQTTNLGGVICKVGLGYTDIENFESAFAQYDKGFAERFLNTYKSLIGV